MGTEILVLPKIYDLIVWLSPKITMFPKKIRMTNHRSLHFPNPHFRKRTMSSTLNYLHLTGGIP